MFTRKTTLGWKKLLHRSHGGTIGRKWRITRVTTRTGNLLVQIMKSADNGGSKPA
jgi:hypothetical protein